MQYTCVLCSAVGASGERNSGPATYHCDVCKARSSMWPTELAQQYRLVRDLRQHPVQSPETMDARCISGLQSEINTLKGVIQRQHSALEAAKAENERLRMLVEMGVKIVDQVLPQCGKIVLDIGTTNNFLIGARGVE